MSDPSYDDADPDVGVGVSSRQMDIAKALAEARAKAEAKAKAEAEAKAKAEAEAHAQLEALESGEAPAGVGVATPIESGGIGRVKFLDTTPPPDRDLSSVGEAPTKVGVATPTEPESVGRGLAQVIELAGDSEIYFNPEKNVYWWFKPSDPTVTTERGPVTVRKPFPTVIDAVEAGAIELGEETIRRTESATTVFVEPVKPIVEEHVRETTPYETYIDAIGDAEREFGEQVIEQYGPYTEAPILGKDIGEMIVEKGIELKDISVQTLTEGKPWEGLGQYLTGVALTGGVSTVRAVTSLVNPVAWGKGLHSLAVLGSTPEAQKQLVESIAKDPFSFSVETGAAIYAGWATGRFLGKVYQGWKEADLAKFYEDFPEEAFYWEDGIPDPRIPHPTDVERMAIKSTERVRIVDDLGAGFLESHQVTKGTLTAEGTATKTLDLRMGKDAYSNWESFAKGYRRTGHDLIPELIPEGIGRLETVYRFGLEYGQTHLPGVTSLPPYFDSALALSISPYVGVLPIAGGTTGLITSITPKLDDPLGVERVDVVQESTQMFPNLEDETFKVIENVEETFRTIEDYVQEQDIFQEQDVIQEQDIIQEIIHIQEPIQEPIQEQEQDIFQEPIYIQETIQEKKQDLTTTQIPVLEYPHYTKQPQRPPPQIPLRQKRKRKRKQRMGLPPLGYEMREYKLPSLGGSKAKGGKLPSLDISSTKIKKSRKKLPKL